MYVGNASMNTSALSGFRMMQRDVKLLSRALIAGRDATHAKTITLDGLKPRWKVNNDDTVLANGQAFVRVAPSNFGRCSLVAAKNELIPPTVKESKTPLLPFSKGLASLSAMKSKQLLSQRRVLSAACLRGPRRRLVPGLLGTSLRL